MLQIKIQRIHSGLTDLFKSNSGEWERHIPDLRQNVEQLSAIKEESFLALVLSESGYYLGVFRRLGGRSGDSIAAWLFIPNDLIVKGIEIERRLNEIRGIISNAETIDTAEEKLKNICKDTFPEKKYIVQPNINRVSKKFAFRICQPSGKHSLQEVLNYLDQDYYPEYSAIFLIESGNLDSNSIINWDNLSDKPLVKKIYYKLPAIPNGFSLIIDDQNISNEEQNQIKTAADLFIKNVTIKRSGYLDVHQFQYPLEELESLDLKTQEWNKVITPKDFKVVSSDEDEVNFISANIEIEELDISDGRWIIPEKNFKEKKFTVKVSAHGYDPCQAKLSLNQNFPIKVKLVKKQKDHHFHIEPHKSQVSFSLEHRKKFKTSPIKGYSIKGKPQEMEDTVDYTLVYKPLAFLKGIFPKILLIIFILCLIGIGYYLGNIFPLENQKSVPARRTSSIDIKSDNSVLTFNGSSFSI